jgi:hypothetical protein
VAQKKNQKKAPLQPVIPKAQPLFAWTPQIKYTILLVLGFFLYVNTAQNQYALDDGGVITGNVYVQQGMKGIGKIMTTDAFSSFLERMHAGQGLTGGRYRPLSIVIFAIQQDLFGNSPAMRHVFNLLCFLATIFAIYYFLGKYMFKHLPYGEDMAFVATVLFTIHPIHTEVVANIKSLDEILSLLFILSTLIFGLKYIEEKQTKHLVIALVSYFLALLSKEYGIMMMILLPLFFYLYPSSQKGKYIGYSLPYYGAAFVYLMLRFKAVGPPNFNSHQVFLNNQLRVDPYYFATHGQKIATEWYSLGEYVRLLFFPYPLSSDYSPFQIPYHSFDLTVLASLLLYIGLLVWGIRLLQKKNMMAFAVFFYLLMLLPISNFVINVGAMVGERFAYHASLGFVILLTYGIFQLIEKSSPQIKRSTLLAFLSVLTLACGAEVVSRNADWKDNNSLFTEDIKNAPNSAFMNCNAAACYINIAQKPENAKRGKNLLDSAVACCYKAIHTDKTFPDPYINMGLAYYCLNNQDSAKYYWDLVQNKLYPNHPDLKRFMPMLARAYMEKGLEMGKQGQPALAIAAMRKGISEDSTNAEIWYNLGGAYYTLQKLDSARYSWMKALQIKPDYTEARQGLNAITPTR